MNCNFRSTLKLSSSGLYFLFRSPLFSFCFVFLFFETVHKWIIGLLSAAGIFSSAASFCIDLNEKKTQLNERTALFPQWWVSCPVNAQSRKGHFMPIMKFRKANTKALTNGSIGTTYQHEKRIEIIKILYDGDIAFAFLFVCCKWTLNLLYGTVNRFYFKQRSPSVRS